MSQQPDATSPLGIAMIGNGFMAKAHTKAIVDAALLRPRRRRPTLVSISGRNESALADARRHWGWESGTTDWRAQVVDPRIEVVHNTAPNALHVDPTLAAVSAGKHVVCEKPLAPTADEAFAMWRAAEQAGVLHLCAFNFRFAPAARLARTLVEAGEIGDVVHVRAQFLESSALRRKATTWRDRVSEAGSGAVGDLGSHIIDLTRWIAGEYVSVQAMTATVVPTRSGERVDVDDAFGALVRFASGATGVIEASRVAGGYGTRCAVEIDGTNGTLRFASERLNDLEHISSDHILSTIRVTGASHPFMDLWWPEPGHAIGWGDTFTHEIDHFFGALAGEGSVAPYGADFEDGYRCAEICDAIVRAAASGRGERIAYRSLPEPARASML